MAELTDDLAELVESIVVRFCEIPEDCEITASETEDGAVLVEISVNEGDVGKVIGRQGRVIKSIRTLARAAASRSGAMAEVELID